MKKSSPNSGAAAAPATEAKSGGRQSGRQNGHTVAVAESASVDLTILLASLQKMQEGAGPRGAKFPPG